LKVHLSLIEVLLQELRVLQDQKSTLGDLGVFLCRIKSPRGMPGVATGGNTVNLMQNESDKKQYI
jgi:hypothetical protein